MGFEQIAVVLAVAVAWILKNKTRLSNAVLPFVMLAGVFFARLGTELTTPAAQAAGLGAFTGSVLTGIWGTTWLVTLKAWGIHIVGKAAKRILDDVMAGKNPFKAPAPGGVAQQLNSIR